MSRHGVSWSRALAIAALLALTGCTSSSGPAEDQITDDAQAVPVPDEPEAPPQTRVLPPQSGSFKAADIMQALSEKTFSYTKGSRSGTVTYYGDGTFSYTETGKGAGTGIWQASDGKLCESFNATSFLPRGTRSECHPFTSTGSSYIAGQTQLTPA